MSDSSGWRERLARHLTPRSRRWLAGGSLGLALILLAYCAALARLEMGILSAGAPPKPDAFVLPSPATARALAAGYTEAIADVVWSRMLVYYGEKATQWRNPKYLKAYMDAITTLDPYFRSPYAWGGYAVVFADPSGVPQLQDLENAIRLLRVGIARFPEDGELHGILGYNLFYELPRWVEDPETVLRSKLEGTEYLRRQASLQGGPEWLALSAASALEEMNLDDLAARHLEESAYATDDPQMRNQILTRLARLQADMDTEAIRRSADTLLGMARERLPYVSPTFFLLLSSREDRERMAVGARPGPWPERPLGAEAAP